MESKQIPANCTLSQYREEFASSQLCRQIRQCLIFGIIAVALLLVIPLIGEGTWSEEILLNCMLYLIPLIVAVLTKSRPWGIAATVISVLWMGVVLNYLDRWLMGDFWYFADGGEFRYLACDILMFLGSCMEILCCTKMLRVLKKIDSEYQDLMANLRG